jgi:hypothetical protein
MVYGNTSKAGLKARLKANIHLNHKTMTRKVYLILSLVVLLISSSAFAQQFEGKITYRNTYTSRIPNVTSEQFASMMGTSQDYFIKGGSYKTNGNGTFFQWQLYSPKENRLYNKYANSETVLWNDGSLNPDSVLKVEVNKDVIEILGYRCDEVILTCKTGVQKYYFSSKLGVDIALYARHLYGNWYDYLKAAKALPLKSIIESQQFALESVATEVSAIKLNDQDFLLPENVKTDKSPY